MPTRRVVTGRSQEPRKRFAEELKLLRTDRGLSLRKLGEALGWDWSLFSKMEKGETVGGPEVVQALDQYYGTATMLLALWELAVGDPTQFKERYRRYMTLEAEAISLWHFAPYLLPGLLQTDAYARTLMGWGGGFEGDELTRQVEARSGRRALLEGENAPVFRTILSETVLRTPLPVRAQWQKQLEWLLTISDRRNVAVQVVPHAAGLYGLANTDVMFLKPTDGRTVAWIETSYSGEFVEETAAVDRLQHRYDLVRDLALSPADSRKFILRTLEEASCEPSI
ncbi:MULTISPECIES: helix-turn-helix domain-containing protein [Streptomyces]|uniref:DNA-binding protein n=1 Tax=Streptomyces viridochromogenes TaxID=1938 RepID=A0A0L8L0J2_STRVR|nr:MULTISPECIES: helix-turn-helix transcriptional regulator [Streptomyces]KOG31733.1 DNA-binding protein [Streptomyces viridochromogenes]